MALPLSGNPGHHIPGLLNKFVDVCSIPVIEMVHGPMGCGRDRQLIKNEF